MDTIAADVAAAAAGDRDAFTRVVRAYQATAVATAYGWLGDPYAATEVAQEAFTDAFRRLADLREPAAFAGWLRRIVVKHCDRATRRRRVPTVPLDAVVDVTESGPGPHELAERSERDRAIRTAVEALEPNLRLVVALHYVAGLTQTAIASYLDLPVSTVDHRLRRARRALREELTAMPDPTFADVRPDVRFTDTVRLFLAVRAGDADGVRALVGRDPTLLDATESWDADLVEAGLAPPPAKATPLIRAIERGDRPMVSLLLELGASVDGACECATGESPLWTAAVFGSHDIARQLLERGAAPDAASTAGTTPLHVATMRGDEEMARLLAEHGADRGVRDVGGRTPEDWRGLDLTARGSTFDTGIKAIELFCPLDRGGATRVVSGVGVGLVVLLGELSLRLASRDATAVVWCGFEQRPFDRVDIGGVLRELGVADDVPLLLAPREHGDAARRDVFANTVAMARRRAEASGEDIVLVVFEEDGFAADVAAALPALGAFERGSLSAVVASPFRSRDVPPLEAPYASQVVFDDTRAQRQLWPAIGHRSSARASDPVAARARAVLDDDPDGGRAALLHAYLSQPFSSAAPFTATPGTFVARDRVRADVERICDGELDGVDPASIAYAGALD